MVTLLLISRRSFIFLNMFENLVNIKLAFYQFLFDSDNGKCHFKSSPRTFWTDLVVLTTVVYVVVLFYMVTKQSNVTNVKCGFTINALLSQNLNLIL